MSDKRTSKARQSQECFRMDVVTTGAVEYDDNTRKHVLAPPKESSHSDGGAIAKERVSQHAVEVIDISFQPNRNLAVLLHDARSKTDVVTLYNLEDVLADKADSRAIEPAQSLTHPIQTKSQRIAWSRIDSDVLAVGCFDGVIVWHTRTRMPIHSFRNALLGVASFHSFSMGHAVDVLAFSKKVSGYFACASTTSGVIKVFALTESPSSSCISTLPGSDDSVEQVDWSNNDTFLAVRYTQSRRVNIFNTSNWSKQTWMLRETSVQHIEWFDEHNVEKLLVVTETALNILRYVDDKFSCETSVQINEGIFKGSSYFKFHSELQTLVTIHHNFCAAHSVTLEHSEQSKIEESNHRTRRKHSIEQLQRLAVFLDKSKRIKFLQPKILV